MENKYVEHIAAELSLGYRQVQAAAALIEEGATVPFIARYRKEATGSLDEVAITAIRDRLAQLAELDKRREAILKSLKERELLTDELKAAVDAAESLSALEDIYLPFRPKRRTRATIAKEKGLEPLAELVFAQDGAGACRPRPLLLSTPKRALSADRGRPGRRAGHHRRDGSTKTRKPARGCAHLFSREGTCFSSKVHQGQGGRGRKVQGLLRLGGARRQGALAPGARHAARRKREASSACSLPRRKRRRSQAPRSAVRHREAARPRSRCGLPSRTATSACFRSSMETETRLDGKEARRRGGHPRSLPKTCASCFWRRLWGRRTSWPSTRASARAARSSAWTGRASSCTTTRSFPDNVREGQGRSRGEGTRASAKRFNIEADRHRQRHGGPRDGDLRPRARTARTSRSSWSTRAAPRSTRPRRRHARNSPTRTSPCAGAVSIGRRLMDPLAELVKIDPKSIGVGQYQHDVDQGALKQSLDDVVMSCVNAVGVEVNTASPQLLTYVSGLGPAARRKHRRITATRTARSRHASDLRRSRAWARRPSSRRPASCGSATAANPLDASAVHPESYPIVEAMAKDLDCHGRRPDEGRGASEENRPLEVRHRQGRPPDAERHH